MTNPKGKLIRGIPCVKCGDKSTAFTNSQIKVAIPFHCSQCGADQIRIVYVDDDGIHVEEGAAA